MQTLLILLTTTVPLFFWTLTPNLFSTPKDGLITLFLLSSLTLLGIHALHKKSLSLPSLATSLPLLFFILTIIGSLLANPEGRPEALQSKALVLLTLPLLSLIFASYSASSLTKPFQKTLLVVSSVLSLHSLISLLFLSKSPYLPPYMQSAMFTPTGSYTTTLILIVMGIFLSLSFLKHAPTKLRTLYITLLALDSVAAITIVALMMPGGSLASNSLSLLTSWSIALDALKSLRSLFFGIGLSNYSLLYTSVKPLAINATPLWNFLPTTAGNELLTLLPTAGVLSVISLGYLYLRLLYSSYGSPLFALSLISLLGFAILPGSTVLYTIFFVLYALALSDDSHTITLNRTQSYTVLGVCVLLAGASLYFTFGVMASELFMRRAQQKLAAGDTQATYQSHLMALRYSPKVTNYHLSFADINFKLASALSQKENLTDTDRDNVTKLIQQSIVSGKTAIALRPNDPRTWRTVGIIYQNLITAADKADSFALEAYGRAVALDRANPGLRLEYANLLSQIADSKKDSTVSSSLNTRALSEIQLATQLKADYSNAYYNLGLLYKRLGNLDAAQKAFETTLTTLTENTQEYIQVKNELDNLRSNSDPSPRPSPAPSSSLTTPSPLPTPIDGGPVELP